MPRKVVLMADDNEDDVNLSLLAFTEIGFPHEVVVARDGEQALDYLFAKGPFTGRDRSRDPALVVLDVRMPKVDGLQVLEALRASRDYGGTPAVMLTTSDEPRDKEAASRLGANLYLKKPLGFDELCDLLRRIQALVPA